MESPRMKQAYSTWEIGNKDDKTKSVNHSQQDISRKFILTETNNLIVANKVNKQEVMTNVDEQDSFYSISYCEYQRASQSTHHFR
jgi:hypothetical protein